MSTPANATRVLVWDLPTRLFHWLLAGAVLTAFTIGVAVDDESPTFSVHMLLGAVAAFMVVLRVVWGFVGSRHARFASFAFGPKAVLAYLRGALTRKDEPRVGHNPGSAWAIFAMMLLVVGVATSGALMSTAGKWMKEVHEILAYTLIGVIGAHVAGVLFHTWRHRQNITVSMLHGHKVGDTALGIRSAHPVVALAFLGLTTTFGAALVRGYNASTHTVTLPFVSTSLLLGEGSEKKDDHGGSHQRGRREHDD